MTEIKTQIDALRVLAKWRRSWSAAPGDDVLWAADWYADALKRNVAALLANPACAYDGPGATKDATIMVHATIASLVAGSEGT